MSDEIQTAQTPEIPPVVQEEADYLTLEKKRHKRKDLRDFFVTLIIGLAIVFLLRAFIFDFALVEGKSMYNTLDDRDRVIVLKTAVWGEGLPPRNSVVVTKYPDKSERFIKRLIAIEGDTIEIRNGKTYVNGKENKYCHNYPPFDMLPITIPKGEIFVMGDNRENSLDSRSSDIGPISKKMLVGQAVCVVWPLSHVKLLGANHLPEQPTATPMPRPTFIPQ